MSLRYYRNLAVLIVMAAVLWQEYLPDGLLYSELKNFIHYIVFTALAWVAGLQWQLLKHLPTLKPHHYVVLIIALALFGGAIEIIQPYFARSRSWIDFAYDMTGASSGCLLHALLNQPQKKYRYLPVLLLLVLLSSTPLAFAGYAQWQQNSLFPVLLDFENPNLYNLTVWSNSPAPTIVATPKAWTNNPGHVGAFVFAGEHWANLGLKRISPDWRGYQRLQLDVYVPEPVENPLNIRIIDTHHNWEYDDRFNRSIPLHTGLNHITISLSDIASAPSRRAMDLSQMKEILLFAKPLRNAPVVYIDNIRLQP